jgi:solute carrier family 44 protein 1 (choline transporter-like protein)
LSNNILRVAALNSVGTFVLFLGKLAVVVSTILIGVQILDVRMQA